MRVWDIEPVELCRNHLLGEHSEIHAVWSIITGGRSGYGNHPEVRRWRGKLAALFERHEKVASEMRCRGYRHDSDLEAAPASDSQVQEELIDSIEEQREKLKREGCGCSRRGASE